MHTKYSNILPIRINSKLITLTFIYRCIWEIEHLIYNI